jgi:hypothetical protein
MRHLNLVIVISIYFFSASNLFSQQNKSKIFINDQSFETVIEKVCQRTVFINRDTVVYLGVVDSIITKDRTLVDKILDQKIQKIKIKMNNDNFVIDLSQSILPKMEVNNTPFFIPKSIQIGVNNSRLYRYGFQLDYSLGIQKPFLFVFGANYGYYTDKSNFSGFSFYPGLGLALENSKDYNVSFLLIYARKYNMKEKCGWGIYYPYNAISLRINIKYQLKNSLLLITGSDFWLLNERAVNGDKDFFNIFLGIGYKLQKKKA